MSSSGSMATRMTGLRANQVQWRVADIYLLRAECRVKLEITGAEDEDKFEDYSKSHHPYRNKHRHVYPLSRTFAEL